MSVSAIFLDFSARKLRQQAARIAVCLGELTQEQLWQRANANSNAIGNLVLHLGGNVRQWIVAGAGGAADVRQRDAEFTADGGVTAAELQTQLNTTIEEACAVLARLDESALTATVSIQGYQVTVLEAVYHVVEHFSGHTGQIIEMTKARTGRALNFYAHLGGAHQERTP